MPKVSKSVKLFLINSGGAKCHYCGDDFFISELTVDHIIPSWLGGLNHPLNYVVSCDKCNAIKGNKTLDEFEESLIDRFYGLELKSRLMKVKELKRRFDKHRLQMANDRFEKKVRHYYTVT